MITIANGLLQIAVPREVIETENLPLLGTGKTDYAAVTRLADERLHPATPRRRNPRCR